MIKDHHDLLLHGEATRNASGFKAKDKLQRVTCAMADTSLKGSLIPTQIFY